MTERAGSACSIGSATQKTLNRNLSTPILSTTKISSCNNNNTNNNKIFLSQSSINECNNNIINNPTSITLTSIQTGNFTSQNTNLNNKIFTNTLKNEPVTLIQSSSKSSLSPPPSAASNSNLSTSIDEPITSSFNQNYMQFICSSAAQSPPSSLSLSENCSNSDDSLTMLDDSLTSLQWLQNLNIMKSAVSGESGANDNEVPKVETNQGGGIEYENKPEIKKDEFSELDLDSAAIPAATNRQKLSCLSKTNEAQNEMPIENPKVVYQTQYSLPVTATTTASTTTKTAKRQNSFKCKQNSTKQNVTSNNNSQFLANNLPQNVPNSNLGSATNINTTNLIKEREEFRTNASVKPPYSYSQLIILAMKESTCSKMTLQMIYDWIIENFSYFKKADPSWQITFKNSIRHNLSLNKCFKKIARQKDEPGKGGFWTLDPDFEKQLNESSGKNGANGNININAPFPTNSIQLDSASSDNNNSNNGNNNTNNSSQKTSFFSFNVTKRRRNGLKANGNKINQNRAEQNEIKQQPTNNVKLNHDFSYQYNLPQFSVNQQQNSPGDNKSQLMNLNDSNLINDVSSAKKFKSDASNSFYPDVQMPHMTSKINYRTSSPSSVSSPANSTCSTNFSNNVEKNGQLLNGSRLVDVNQDNNNNNRIFVRSDSNWGNQINCDQILLSSNSNKTLNLNYSQTNQQPRSNHQNQLINQEYFQANNNQMNNSQNSLGQQYLLNSNDQKHKYISPIQNVNQQSPHNQQTFNNNSNFISTQSQSNDRNYQGQMTLNFDDSLTGYNHQNSQNFNSNNGYSINLNDSLNKKFNNQTSFNNNDSTNNLSVMPASAMINSVEDMTGTFSSSFAHEIIKSMDDGTLFSFEENLVCNFDQLDETTNDFNTNCLSSSLLNNTNSNSCLNNNTSHVKNCQQNQASNSTPNVDEFVNEFFKITSKPQSSTLSPNSISNLSPSSASCSSTNSNNSQFLGNQTFNANDKELIELFEYTSHFNMDDDTNNSTISRTSNNFVNDVPPSHYVNSNHIHQNSNLHNNSPRNLLQYSNSSSTASSTSSSSSSSPQIEQMANSKIDLTVEGHSINQPKWWMEPGSLDYRPQQLNHAQDDECDSTMFINQLNNNSHQNLNSIELKDILNDTNLNTVNNFNSVSIDGNLNGMSCLMPGNTQSQQHTSPQTKQIGNYFINETLINTVPDNSEPKQNQKQAKKRIYTHSKEKLPKSNLKSESKASVSKKAKSITNKKVNELMLN